MSIIHTVVVSDGQSIWGLGRKPGMVLKVKLAFRCLTFISVRHSNDSHVYTLSSVASRDASARFHVGRRPKLSRQSLATFVSRPKMFVQEVAYCVYSVITTVSCDESV